MTLFKAAKLSNYVRRSIWKKGYYIYHSDHLGFSSIFVGDRFDGDVKAAAFPLHMTKDDLFATDWTTYEREQKIQPNNDRETNAGDSQLRDRVLEPPCLRR